MPRRWHQRGDNALSVAPGMVTKSPITRESTKETVKTIVQGMPDRFGDLW
jgi:hypothetical protein